MGEYRKRKIYLNKPVSMKVIRKVKKIQREHKEKIKNTKFIGKKKPKPLYFYEALEILIMRCNK